MIENLFVHEKIGHSKISDLRELGTQFFGKSTKKKKKYSARAIFHRLVWEDLISDSTSYRIDFNTTPFLSRLVMKAEPGLGGMFQKRVQKKRKEM